MTYSLREYGIIKVYYNIDGTLQLVCLQERNGDGTQEPMYENIEKLLTCKNHNIIMEHLNSKQVLVAWYALIYGYILVKYAMYLCNPLDRQIDLLEI